VFFPEEKNQKTFMPCASREIRDLAGNLEAAVTLSLSSKRHETEILVSAASARFRAK
jgi:hypothetical protein